MWVCLSERENEIKGNRPLFLLITITSDMPEMIDVADRILVMDGYRIHGEVENDRNYDRVSQAIMGCIHAAKAA